MTFKFLIFLGELLHCSDFLCLFIESRLEGWLSLPVRNNTKKFGWVKKVIGIFEYVSFALLLV